MEFLWPFIMWAFVWVFLPGFLANRLKGAYFLPYKETKPVEKKTMEPQVNVCCPQVMSLQSATSNEEAFWEGEHISQMIRVTFPISISLLYINISRYARCMLTYGGVETGFLDESAHLAVTFYFGPDKKIWILFPDGLGVNALKEIGAPFFFASLLPQFLHFLYICIH